MRNILKKLLTTVLLLGPLSGFTQFNSNQSAYILDKNYLANPGAEQGLAGWTSSVAGKLDRSTSTVRNGIASFAWNPNLSGQTLSTTLVAIPEGNGACITRFFYKGFGTADIRMYMKDNSGNVIAGYTSSDTSWAITNAASTWTKVEIPFACPASGTTVQLVLEARGDVAVGYIDDAYLGRDYRAGNSEVSAYLGQLTTTGSWTANTTYTGNYWRSGEWLHGEVKIALSGAPTSATLTVTLPNSLNINTSKLVYADNGRTVIGSKAQIRDSGSNSYGVLVMSDSSTPTVIQPVYTDDAAAAVSVNNTITQAAPITFASGDAITFSFDVPILEWANSAGYTVKGDNSAWFVDATINTDGMPLGTATDGAFAAPNNSALTLTNSTVPGAVTAKITCSSTNAPSGTTCSSGNEEVGIAFTPRTTGPLEVCAEFGYIPISPSLGGEDMEMSIRMARTANNSQTELETGNSVTTGNVQISGTGAKTREFVRSCITTNISDTSTESAFRFQKQITTYNGSPAPTIAGTTHIYARPIATATSKSFIPSSVFYSATNQHGGETGITTIETNTYTATLSNTTNVAASTFNKAFYTRIGNRVYVEMSVDIDPTAAAPTNTELRFTLPFSLTSAFGSVIDLVGGGTVDQNTGAMSGMVKAVSGSTTQGALKFSANDATNRTWNIHFTYDIN